MLACNSQFEHNSFEFVIYPNFISRFLVISYITFLIIHRLNSAISVDFMYSSEWINPEKQNTVYKHKNISPLFLLRKLENFVEWDVFSKHNFLNKSHFSHPKTQSNLFKPRSSAKVLFPVIYKKLKFLIGEGSTE